MQSFFDRIDYSGTLEDISIEVCRAYKLGTFKSNSLVLTGFEDFNFILETSKGKYFVKIFSDYRDDAQCIRYVDIMRAAIEAGISTPVLIKSNTGYLAIIKVNGKKLRLSVSEFIHGKNLLELKNPLTEKEIRFLAKQAAIINRINYKPTYIYDSWAITNFLKEYAKCSKKLPKKDLDLIKPLVEKFKSLDIENLPHCFIHGDIHAMNIIKDKTGKLWIIDFSCSDYAPRIQELAVLACDLLFDSDKEKREKNLKIALEEYQKTTTLTKKEILTLPLYIKFAHAMYFLKAEYERIVSGNQREDSMHLIFVGREGLKN